VKRLVEYRVLFLVMMVLNPGGGDEQRRSRPLDASTALFADDAAFFAASRSRIQLIFGTNTPKTEVNMELKTPETKNKLNRYINRAREGDGAGKRLTPRFFKATFIKPP
jgi:hypothetical protein